MLAGDSSEAAVRAFVAALNAGTPGDAKAGLRVFKGRPHANLVQSYGAEFAKALESRPPGEWQALRTRDGWRAMRLEAITPARPAVFEALRGVVLQDWTDATLAEQRTAAVRALAKKYKREASRAASAHEARLLRWLLLAALALLAGAAPASAHEMSMAEMEVRETAPGEFLWQWSAAATSARWATDLTPLWPDGCTAEAERPALRQRRPARHAGHRGRGQALLRRAGEGLLARRPDAASTRSPARQPTVQLYGSADDRRGMGEIARAYTVLGVEHILSGIDHLLFVVGLLFLVGFGAGWSGPSPPSRWRTA